MLVVVVDTLDLNVMDIDGEDDKDLYALDVLNEDGLDIQEDGNNVCMMDNHYDCCYYY